MANTGASQRSSRMEYAAKALVVAAVHAAADTRVVARSCAPCILACLLIAALSDAPSEWDSLLDMSRWGGALRCQLAAHAADVGEEALLRVSLSMSAVPKRSAIRRLWDQLARTRRGGQRKVARCACAPVAESRPKSAKSAPRTPPPRVGALKCAFDDHWEPLQLRGPLRRPIAQWTPLQLRPAKGSLAALMPVRRKKWAEKASEAQQRGQRQRVQEWNLARWAAGCTAVYTMASVARAWKKRQRKKVCGGPRGQLSRAVAVEAMRCELAPTATASPNGHWHDAATGRPLQLPQFAALMGVLWCVPRLAATLAVVTASQLRSLLGQGCHGGSMELVLARARSRMGSQRWLGLQSFSSLGAGVGCAAAAVAKALGSGCRYVAWAEGCAIAQRAHEAYWADAPTQPKWFCRAEAPELADPAWRADIEVITLRCAPFSMANRYYPRGRAAALAELQAVMEGVRARGPELVIYENTRGLWRERDTRLQVEAILRTTGADYEWESSVVDPARHLGVPVQRARVFYVGVRRQ